MADKAITHSILERFGNLMSSPLLNAARPTGFYGEASDLKTLRGTLAERGWLKDTNGTINADRVSNTWDIDTDTVNTFAAIGVKVDKRLPLKQLAELEVIRRQGVWERLKVEKAEDPGPPDKPSVSAIKLLVFEKLFVEKGKVITPTLMTVTGNRRSSVFFDSCVERYSLIVPIGEKCPDGSEGDGKKTYGIEGVDPTLPVVIDDYSGNRFRLEAQLRENEMKKKGFLPGSQVDQLLATIKMMEYGASQSRIRETFGSPTIGVKLYYMNVLDKRYKNLRIVERCKLKQENPDSIPLSMVQHQTLQGMAQRFDKASTDEYNAKKSTKGGPYPVLTEAEVARYFSTGIRDKKTEGVKMMDKGSIETLKASNSNPIIRKVAEAIHNNDTKDFEQLIRMSDGCDALMLLESEGDYPFAEKVLKAIAVAQKGEERNALEKKIAKVIG